MEMKVALYTRLERSCIWPTVSAICRDNLMTVFKLYHSCLRPKCSLPLLLQLTTSHLDTSKSSCSKSNLKRLYKTGFKNPNLLNAHLLKTNLSSTFCSLVLYLLSVDLASILPKTGVTVGGSVDSDLGAIVDGPSAEDLGQSLVFTNSHHNGRTATHSYAHATANSYAHAASASTTYAHAALVFLTTHTHTFQRTHIS